VDTLAMELKTIAATGNAQSWRRQPDSAALQSISERLNALRDEAYQEIDELLGR
jgi:hypothetical protein